MAGHRGPADLRRVRRRVHRLPRGRPRSAVRADRRRSAPAPCWSARPSLTAREPRWQRTRDLVRGPAWRPGGRCARTATACSTRSAGGTGGWTGAPTNAERFGSTVARRLGELADERLRQRHGLTRASDPARARELLGDQAVGAHPRPGRRLAATGGGGARRWPASRLCEHRLAVTMIGGREDQHVSVENRRMSPAEVGQLAGTVLDAVGTVVVGKRDALRAGPRRHPGRRPRAARGPARARARR